MQARDSPWPLCRKKESPIEIPRKEAAAREILDLLLEGALRIARKL